jgi:hypothetical protein
MWLSRLRIDFRIDAEEADSRMGVGLFGETYNCLLILIYGLRYLQPGLRYARKFRTTQTA